MFIKRLLNHKNKDSAKEMKPGSKGYILYNSIYNTLKCSSSLKKNSNYKYRRKEK
jgi:hypothetical protein